MTSFLDTLAPLAWAQLWQVTVVALLVAAVVRCCCRSRPRLAYVLWMLVIVKVIVPPLWSSPTGIFSWALAGPVATNAGIADGVPGAIADSPQAIAASEGAGQGAPGDELGAARYRALDWSDVRLAAFCLWATGLVLSAGYVLTKQLLAWSLIRRSSLAVDERLAGALGELSQRLGVKPQVRLVVASRPIGPAAYGLLRPSILLPGPMLTGQFAEHVDLVLAHELIHIRRGDVLASQLQLVAQLVWWFNPLVWWVSQQVGRERERCCDEEVISGVGCKPARYARALLSVLEQKERFRSLVALPGVRALEVTSLRLESIMNHAQTDHRRAAQISRLLFATGLLLLIPGTGITLQGHVQASDDPGGPAPAATLEQKMQGKWKIVRCEFSGQADTGIIGTQHTIEGNKWLRPNRRTAEYRLSVVDAAKNPMWVDLSADRLEGQTLKGICSLEGDKLTICYAYDPDLARPTEFKTTPDTKGYLYVLERVKKEDAGKGPGDGAPPSSTADPNLAKLQGKWTIESCESSGQADNYIVGVQDTIEGNKWLRPKRRTGEYRLNIVDALKSPMWVNLSADRLGDETLKGICSLDGDKWTICYSYNPNLPRPTEFKTTADARAYLYVLMRAKD